ncbi:Toxin YoeB [Candidatus Jidaibacter acanthamoeba]|uniref:Putative mRNA interferase YoeB n=1 Tax=Candidatus Jidaibacter acanthamoebae TaxID=86105 RepID=A0A0C1MR92_9RICK|nr:Txe/YoeB family addiction module toxin [Candidatus Jidaibacter acanthamoeba]KIE04542.1 Toxin YoeB [Candidatus Jidaibacter acanthamoeba]
MKILFIDNAWDDYLYWQKNDKRILQKINELIKEITRSPFNGKGMPEPLKFDMAGCWSRRITMEHRLVYRIKDESLIIIQCRYHY